MRHTTASALAVSTEVRDFIQGQERKSLLRFLTCGSVDDGKSTLIGRLLSDTKQILDDQLLTLENDSRRHGTTGEEVDFALLVDGLEAEREQGITIDVAYRFFATEKRKFIVADTPGHEQYTRNMATGASTADLAIVLVDARLGVLRQTRRHSFIASLLGIRNVVLAVNKIDLVGHDQAVFERISRAYREAVSELGFTTVRAIPISARYGDNVMRRSEAMPWYNGPTLIEHLESVPVDQVDDTRPFRFPVQYVSRPDLNFRGFAGTVASGSIGRGDEVVVAKSGRSSRVSRIVTYDGDLDRAAAGQAVTIVLEDEIEVSRGNMLVTPAARPDLSDRLSASIVWFGEEPLKPGRSYVLRTETDQTSVTITELTHRIDINDFTRQKGEMLEMNEVGVCLFAAQSALVFDPFASNRATGAFVLIDRVTNATVGAGMIIAATRRADNVHWQALSVDRAARAAIKHQKPAVFWFTGLSGSGKSTIANLLEKKLHAAGRHTVLLDGDNIRHGLNRDLGFSDADRAENIRRVAEVARLMVDAGLIVLVSFISPFRSERELARRIVGEGSFLEVFVDTPFEECARRDPKGLYARALAGGIANFTGLDSPYERPENPDFLLETLGKTPDDMVEAIDAWLQERGNADERYEGGDGI